MRPFLSHLSLFLTSSFDSIGKIGFSHDFGCLNGNTSPIMNALDTLASDKPSLAAKLIFLIGPMFPGLLARLPNRRKGKTWDFAVAVEKVALGVLERHKADEEAGKDLDQSIIGSVGE